MPTPSAPRRLLANIAPAAAALIVSMAAFGPVPAAGPIALSPSWEVPIPDTPAPFLVGTATGFALFTRAGRAAAYAPGAAEPIWQTDLAATLETTPVFAHGRLAAAARTAEGYELIVIDALDGTIVSRHGSSGAPPTLTAVEGGILAAEAGPDGQGLLMLDPATGAVRWKTPLRSAASAPAARCGDAILVGGADGTITALAADDGAVRWSEKVADAITTPPFCVGRRAWVGSADNRLHALKLRRRGIRKRWSYLTGGDIGGRIVRYGSRLLFFSYDTYLYALEEGKGHLAWKVRLGRRPQTHAVLIGDLLLVAPLNSERMEAFHLPDGAQAGALSLVGGKERFVTPPVRAGGTVVIAAARYGEQTSRAVGVEPAASPAPAGPQEP